MFINGATWRKDRESISPHLAWGKEGVLKMPQKYFLGVLCLHELPALIRLVTLCPFLMWMNHYLRNLLSQRDTSEGEKKIIAAGHRFKKPRGDFSVSEWCNHSSRFGSISNPSSLFQPLELCLKTLSSMEAILSSRNLMQTIKNLWIPFLEIPKAWFFNQNLEIKGEGISFLLPMIPWGHESSYSFFQRAFRGLQTHVRSACPFCLPYLHVPWPSHIDLGRPWIDHQCWLLRLLCCLFLLERPSSSE